MSNDTSRVDGEKLAAKGEDEKNFKEKIYDQIKVPIWVVDIIIAVSVVALIAVVILGRKASGR